MADKRDLTHDEKLALLDSFEPSEDFFTDYSPTILQFVDDPDADVRARAIRLLWDYPRPDLIDLLMGKVRRDPSQEVVSAALGALGRYIYEGDTADYEHSDEWPEVLDEEEISQADFERTRDFLLAIARDPQASLDSRRHALESLSFLADAEVTELIEQAYNGPEVESKASAILAMGRQGTVRWNDVLLRELDSSVPALRAEAVRAAGEGFLEEATPRLMEIARTGADKELRLEAILSLGRTGGDAALAFLEQLTKSKDEEVRSVAEAGVEDWHTYHGEWDEDDDDEWDSLGDDDWDEDEEDEEDEG